MAYQSFITIEELASVAGAGTRRRVVLEGTGLPFRAPEWGGEMGMKTKWYPGNGEEATQDVFGPRESSSKWEGDWRRTLLQRSNCSLMDETGTVSQVNDPMTIAQFLEDIFRSGRLLRVTWNAAVGDSSGQISRVGRAKSYKFKPDTWTRVAWEIEWEWSGRGGTKAPVIKVRGPTIATNAAAYLAVLAAITKAQQARVDAANAPQVLTLGQLETLANAPGLLVQSLARKLTQVENQVKQVADLANTIATIPAQIEKLAINAAKNGASIAHKAYQALSSIPAEYQSNKGGAAEVLRAWSTFGQVQDATLHVARASREFGDNVRTATARHTTPGTGKQSQNESAKSSNVLATYVTRDGDTPHRISQRFYRDPDHGVDILKANRLPWHLATFPKGKVLIIPVLRGSRG